MPKAALDHRSHGARANEIGVGVARGNPGNRCSVGAQRVGASIGGPHRGDHIAGLGRELIRCNAVGISTRHRSVVDDDGIVSAGVTRCVLLVLKLKGLYVLADKINFIKPIPADVFDQPATLDFYDLVLCAIARKNCNVETFAAVKVVVSAITPENILAFAAVDPIVSSTSM